MSHSSYFFSLCRTVAIPVYAKPQISYHEVKLINYTCILKIVMVKGLDSVHVRCTCSYACRYCQTRQKFREKCSPLNIKIHIVISWVTNYSIILARNFNNDLLVHMLNYKITMATFGLNFLDIINKSKTP